MEQMTNEIIQALELKVKVLQDILRSRDLEVKAALDDLKIVVMALKANPKGPDLQKILPDESRTPKSTKQPKLMQDKNPPNVGGVRIIKESHSFMKGDTHVSLTTREFVIFNFMLQNPGDAVTREQLIEQFSGETDMTARNIDVHIFSLRKKVQKVGLSIETVWGTGYRLILE